MPLHKLPLHLALGDTHTMKMIIKILMIVYVSCLCFSTYAEEGIENEIKRAVYLFQTKRFQNSEEAVKSIIGKIKGVDSQRINYYNLLYYYALSISEQGRTNGLKSIWEERLRLGKELAGEASFETAKNQLNMGEMYYREGDVANALLKLDQAVDTYKKLHKKPEGFLDFIASNKEEYLASPFKKEKLPEDFSQFYTTCESLVVGNDLDVEREKMKAYSQPGVDFEPEGIYKDIFSAKLIGVSGIPKHSNRVVIIPRNDESVYDEWCVLYELKDKLIGVQLNEG
jgi:tetratricopeptide (TPR) repeat protein